MHEMETCATCRYYKANPGEDGKGTCRRICTPTRSERWCVWYRHYITGRTDAAPKEEKGEKRENEKTYETADGGSGN